jgi:opacity protein-like surface antigen
MKRMIAIGVLGSSLLAAASVNAATWQVGVKGGVAIQTLRGDDVNSDQVDNRTGFAGGAYFQSDLSRNFGLRLETLYFMKGASADIDTLGTHASVTVKLDYVEFPLLAVAHLPLSEKARVDIFGGPTFAFNTSAKAEATVNGFSGSADIGDGVKGFDFGLTFGAGINFNVGSAIIGIDGRYGFGLDSVVDSDALNNVGFDRNADAKNRGFAVMASIGVPVGSK